MDLRTVPRRYERNLGDPCCMQEVMKTLVDSISTDLFGRGPSSGSSRPAHFSPVIGSHNAYFTSPAVRASTTKPSSNIQVHLQRSANAAIANHCTNMVETRSRKVLLFLYQSLTNTSTNTAVTTPIRMAHSIQVPNPPATAFPRNSSFCCRKYR